MNIPTAVPRWCAALAAAGVLVITSAAGAGAASEQGRTAAPGDGTIRAAQPAWTASGYRGVQGGNLCLLARCSVGDSTAGGSAGPSNTQGFNLCLLALCTVRP